MPKLRKRRDISAIADRYDTDHPFVRWFAAYSARDAATSEGADVMMGPLASNWFWIGVDDTDAARSPVLGVSEHDAEAIASMKWTAAFLVRRTKKSDWVVLVCRDARIDAPGSDTPVPLRLWLPASPGILDGWLDQPAQPGTLRMVEVAVRRNRPEPKGKPLGELPLKFWGTWTTAVQAAANLPATRA